MHRITSDTGRKRHGAPVLIWLESTLLGAPRIPAARRSETTTIYLPAIYARHKLTVPVHHEHRQRRRCCTPRRYRQHHPPHSHAGNNHRDIANDQCGGVCPRFTTIATIIVFPFAYMHARMHRCNRCVPPTIPPPPPLSFRPLWPFTRPPPLPASFSCASIPSIFSPFR